MEPIVAAAPVAVMALCCIAAAQDLLTLHIDDALSWAVAGLFAGAAGIALATGAMTPLAAAERLGLAGAVFLVGLLLFAVGAVGGADVKLLSVVAPWIEPAALTGFLLTMLVAGGVISAGLLLARVPGLKQVITQWLRIESFTDCKENRHNVPYGLAIATGVVMTWGRGGLGLALPGGAG
jgi:prepilin peptidase CpaA